jgi:galactokinase
MLQQEAPAVRENISRERIRADVPAPVIDFNRPHTLSPLLGPGSEVASRWLVQAPGRIDLMGGLTEHTGALLLSMTTRDRVSVVVAPRSDERLAIRVVGARPGDHEWSVSFPLGRLLQPDGTVVDGSDARRLLGVEDGFCGWCILGGVAETFRHVGTIPRGGWSVLVGPDLLSQDGVARHAALVSATIVAAGSALGSAVEAHTVARLCAVVERNWVRRPLGIGNALCSLIGHHDAVNRIRLDPLVLGHPIPLPDHLQVRGVHCGAEDPEAPDRYLRARTSTAMGRMLIERIVRHEGAAGHSYDGRLCSISVADYVSRYRDRLPTRLAGAEFLSRFGPTDEPFTFIDPHNVYKIRSRTEHHIYEHARAEQLAAALSRAAASDETSVLGEIGDLMHASHWSYGQRCGLGSRETDLLAGMVRRQPAGRGLHGARVSGNGCAGVVVVFMNRSPRAEEALQEAIDHYQTRTGLTAHVITPSSPGALVSGAQRF